MLRQLTIAAFAVALGAASFSFAADEEAPATRPVPPVKIRVNDMMLPGSVLMGDPLNDLITKLGGVNLKPGFTLSEDQKKQIEQIREDYATKLKEWRTQNDPQLQKLQDQMRMAGNAIGVDREKWRRIAAEQQQIMATMPKSDEPAAQIRKLLTPEQLKMFEEYEAKLAAENRQRMKELRERFGGGQGGVHVIPRPIRPDGAQPGRGAPEPEMN